MNKNILINVGCVAVGAAAGSTITYFAVRKRVRKEAFTWANEEIESVKDTYKLLRKEPPYDDPVTAARAYLRRINDLDSYVEAGIDGAVSNAADDVEAASEALEEAVDELQQTEELAEETEEILETQGYAAAGRERVRNIFDEAAARASMRNRGAENFTEPEDEDEVIEGIERGDELQRRDPNLPHVITTAEFMDDSNDFAKITITYYEGDDTLADGNNQPIPDVEQVMGVKNLQKFGVDSDSKDIVYIRNERLETDFEVVKEEEDFATAVYGTKIPAEDNRRRVPRMRDDE